MLTPEPRSLLPAHLLAPPAVPATGSVGSPGSGRVRSPRSRRSAWRRATLRKGLAAVLAAVAAWVAVTAATAAGNTVTVVAASSDLSAGHRLAAGDLVTVHVDPGAVPRAAVTDPAQAVGTVLPTALAAHEILISSRLRPASAYGALAGNSRAVHLPVGDAGSLGLVRAGDHVDVVSIDSGAVVGADLLVLGVDPETQSGGGLTGAGASSPRGIVVAAPPEGLKTLLPAAAATSGDGVHLALRPA